MRFKDPEGRTDAAGRTIIHELIVDGADTADVHSVSEGVAAFWPLVADEYLQVWDSETPPKTKS